MKMADPITSSRLAEVACAALQRTGSDWPLGRLARSAELAGGVQRASLKPCIYLTLSEPSWATAIALVCLRRRGASAIRVGRLEQRCRATAERAAYESKLRSMELTSCFRFSRMATNSWMRSRAPRPCSLS